MNSLERYIKTIKGEQVDHLARIPIVMQFAAEYIDSNYGKFSSDYHVLVEANIQCAKDFGFDQLSAISDPYRETQGFGAEIEYVENGVPRCITLPLKNKDLNTLKNPDPYTSERMFDRIKAIRLYKEKSFGKYSIMGWVEGPAAEAADVYGLSEFYMDIMLDSDFIVELMDKVTDTAIEFARAQLEAGADTIGIGDAVCSQISPEVYEKFILPREKILVDAIKAMGGYVRLHICGNIDPVSGIKDGDPDTIASYISDTYKAVGNPMMVCAGCEIPSKTPNKNLKSLCTPVKWVNDNEE